MVLALRLEAPRNFGPRFSLQTPLVLASGSRRAVGCAIGIIGGGVLVYPPVSRGICEGISLGWLV